MYVVITHPVYSVEFCITRGSSETFCSFDKRNAVSCHTHCSFNCAKIHKIVRNALELFKRSVKFSTNEKHLHPDNKGNTVQSCQSQQSVWCSTFTPELHSATAATHFSVAAALPNKLQLTSLIVFLLRTSRLKYIN